MDYFFNKTPSYLNLCERAKQAPDLSDPSILTENRMENYVLSSCGIKLLYATERVNLEILSDLWNLAEESYAIEKMQKMQEGDCVNQVKGVDCENRSALHTATRSIFGELPQGEPAMKASLLAREELKKLQGVLKELDQGEKFTDLLIIGIGGSELGPKALYHACRAYCKKQRRLHFISNIDPDHLCANLEHLDLNKTLVLVISKSGTTLETLTNEYFVRQIFKKRAVDQKGHFWSVTKKSSPMDDTSRYEHCFYIWDFVGGRYSSSSMVGAVPLSFVLGYDLFLEILRGAHDMDKAALAPSGENLPLLMALLTVWNGNFLSSRSTCLVPYSDALAYFPSHVQQLSMESNGKSCSSLARALPYCTEPVVWGEVGSNCQHSFFQLLHQGTDVVPVEFLLFAESQRGIDFDFESLSSQKKLLSNGMAQALALAQGKKDGNINRNFQGNRPSRILMARCLDLYTLGALLSLYESKIVYEGFLWNINSFDQEGVQLGKKLAKQFMDLYLNRSLFDLGKSMMKHLEF